MTQITCESLDFKRFLAEQQWPEKCLRRENGIWRVRAQPMAFDGSDSAQNWTLVRDGELVRIPLHPYRTNDLNLASMVMSACDLGFRIGARQQRIRRVHWIYGQEVEDLRQTDGVDAFRYWIGVAIRVD